MRKKKKFPSLVPPCPMERYLIASLKRYILPLVMGVELGWASL
jgi:hypothetical protein